ncbi:ABC transporter ATP-binding protein [Virgibacillus sp. C22-A2]|uniref:ABC transporter ATP-binding protein n=1 Tax=Virgibacillus tibetensis TaxID=3042313 RepID=A0ABU6KG39_9BACI|nr:ABC transporter ATP-binding protein [Virgibacillus sp. C22-A2]
MTILKVTNLSKEYDGVSAVKNISFEFTSGKCISLIGPNGAGKTTILRTLAGLLKPSSGKVTFTEMKQQADIRLLIGYLPQHPVFYSWMTGKEFLVYSAQLAFLTKEEANKRAEYLLERVGIAEAKNKRIGKYSGGMKQRLGIAQAIIHKPKLLMLDEPVSSLDPIGRREVLILMEELKKEMTILFSTHILSDADEVSDELLLLRDGEIVEAGTMDKLRRKYQTAKIELVFQNNLEYYKDKIDTMPAITSTNIERGKLHVTAADITQARKEILQAAAVENWPITDFTLNRASLEDMFMKVVNN